MMKMRYRVPAGTLVQKVRGTLNSPELISDVLITQNHCIFDINDMPLGVNLRDFTFKRDGKISIRNCYTFQIPGRDILIRVPSLSVETFAV